MLHAWAKQLPNHEQLVAGRAGKIQDALSNLDDAYQSQDITDLMRALKKTDALRKSAILLSPQETSEFLVRAMRIAANPSFVALSCSARALALCASLLNPRTPALVPLVQNVVGWEQLLELARVHELPQTATAMAGSEEILKSHSDALGTLIRVARYYQPAGSSEQVWSRFAADVSDKDSCSLHESQLHLYLFYPGGTFNAHPRAQEVLESWMHSWGLVDHNSGWDAAWFGLVRRLLKANPAVQIEHHLNRLFGKFYANLKLGGGGGGASSGGGSGDSASLRKFSPWQQAMSSGVKFQKAAKLLVQVLHVGDAIKRLEHFVQSIHTFMHPSNHGSHADRLSSFLAFLCEAFAKRIGTESSSPSPSNLSKETKKRFIACLYPLIEMGLYSKSLGVIAGCQAALRHLSWLAPVTMAKLTLEVVRQGLDPSNVTRPHQAAAGMKILTATVQSLVFGSPQSRLVILPQLCDFLEDSLPGIDPNDSRKTAVTLLMSYSVVSCIPLVGQEHFTPSPATCCGAFGIDGEDGDLAPGMEVEFGNRLEEWGLAFFRRLFTLAQSRGQRAKRGPSAQMDNIIDFFLKETISLCYTQLFFRRSDALGEIAKFLLQDSALPEAHREAQSFAFCLVRADPETALQALVPTLVERIDAKGDVKTVTWSLVVLGSLVRHGGRVALTYAPQVELAIARSFAHKDAKVRYLGAKLLRRLARGLLATYPFANSTQRVEFNPEYDEKNNELQVKWHLPSEEEVLFAGRMLGEYKQRAFAGLLQSSSQGVPVDSSVTDKERTNHQLIVLFQCIRGGLTHFNLDTEHEARQLIAVTALLEASSNIHGLKLCIKSLVLLASKAQGPKGGGNESYLYTYKAWTAWLRDVSQNRAVEAQIRQRARDDYYVRQLGTGSPPDVSVSLKHMLLSDYEFLLEKETYLASFDSGLVTRQNVHESSQVLLKLCFHPFSAVRKCAQTQLEFVDLRCRFAFREQIVSAVIPKLASSKPEEFTGAIYLLRHGSALRLINLNFAAMRAFLLTALGDGSSGIRALPAFRQAKAQERLAKLVGSVLNRWQPFSTRHVPEQQSQAVQLLMDLVKLANRSGDWRTQLSVLTVIAVLIPSAAEATQANAEIARFVLDMCKHEMLPTRLAALFVLRRLMLVDGDSAAKQLLQRLDQAEVTAFWLLAGATLGQDRTSGEDQWSAGVGDNIKLVKTLVRRPKFPRLSSNSVSRDFHTSKVDLMVSFCEAMPVGAALLPSLRELATEGESSKDRAERKLSACEMFAAVLRVRPELAKELLPVLLRMLAELPNASNWCDAATYVACFSADKAALLMHEVEAELNRKTAALDSDGEPETEGERERGFSYTCNLIKVLGCILEERRDALSPNTFTKFEQFLVHPYKAVRQAAATSFAMFFLHCQGLDSDEGARSVQTAMLAIKDTKEGLESCLCFVAVLVTIAPAKLILGPIVLPLLGPVVFQAQGHQEVELALLAKNVLNLCSVGLTCFAADKPQQVVEFEAALIKDFAAHAEWTKRRALCTFLRSFHALHSTFLLGMGAGALVQRTSEDLLNDSQGEVRDAARLLLLSLLIAVPVQSLESAKDRYCRMVANPKKRQQGILALTALVETSPYSVPSALPPSLMALCNYVNHPLLGLQVKKTLSEFRRTHIDEWAEHKLAFSEQELGALEGVLFSPDYYA